MSGPQLLARQVQRLSAQAIGAKQPDLVGLMAAWSDIVGAEWAARCTPLSFKRGRANQPAILELGVPAGEALLVQHESPVLLGRINSYFGGGFVKALRLKPMEMARPPRRRVVKELVPLAVEGVDDPELAATLGRLGAALRESGKTR